MMKKLFISLLFVFGILSTSHAQGKGKIELGFGLGYSTYTVTSSNIQASSGIGINFAGSAEYYFSDRWGIKTKLVYDQKGWNDGFIRLNPDDFSYTTDYKLNYLTVPVLGNWHFGKKRNWYLNFGPYLGFLLNAKETTLGTDVKDAFNGTDFGLALGIGVKIPVSNNLKVLIEYDGQSGMTNIFKTSNTTVRNSRSSFNIGLNYTLK